MRAGVDGLRFVLPCSPQPAIVDFQVVAVEGEKLCTNLRSADFFFFGDVGLRWLYKKVLEPSIRFPHHWDAKRDAPDKKHR